MLTLKYFSFAKRCCALPFCLLPSASRCSCRSVLSEHRGQRSLSADHRLQRVEARMSHWVGGLTALGAAGGAAISSLVSVKGPLAELIRISFAAP
jgi:hypothetical protein